MKLQIKLAHIAHVDSINLKLDKLNAQNAPTSQVALVLQLEMELDQHLIVKNVVQLENISTLILVFAVLVVMDSSNQTKVHSHVTFVGWAKQQDQQKQNRVLSVAMNVHQECNLVLMENANHVQEAHSDLKEFNQLVKHVH